MEKILPANIWYWRTRREVISFPQGRKKPPVRTILNHWAALVFTDGSIQEIDYGSSESCAAACARLDDPSLMGMASVSHADFEKGGDPTLLKQNAVEKVKQTFEVYRAELERMKDPIYAFEKALKSHDWTYMFSDDHRYWSAGERQWKEIQQMAENLDGWLVVALLAKYSESH